ncbi:hypothetical protein [Enterococcus larvae]|uniref:hypothetical protein n=1 Tax=Enterococcus larvae TaxID=2794352 RepID=UPI003F3F3932
MGFNGWKRIEPSEKSKQFVEGQEVSFMYRKEMRNGKVEVLMANSAVIAIEDLPHQKAQNEKTVINYEELSPADQA